MKITICGSVSIADKKIPIYEKLKELGHEPIMHPHMYDFARGTGKVVEEAIADRPKAKRNLYIKWYHDAILESDAILVCNFDKGKIKNYIGGNTLMEIGFAFTTGKKVFLLNPAPEEVSYSDEIRAMTDEVIEGDLTKIK